MASIQTKIGWKRQRKTENKNYRFVTFLPDEFKKYHYAFFPSQNKLEKAEKERK